jgi:hypothetical protein
VSRRCKPYLGFGLVLVATFAPAQAVTAELAANKALPITATASTVRAPAIVLGFVGGYVKHDNLVHAEVQLAARLRKEYPSGLHAEAFENHRGRQAYQQVLRLLDTDHDGTLSAEEKQDARIILYGHSWGASEAINLARTLERDGIPVLLTVQVDSVSKQGEDDSSIPANVIQAANFYQPKGLVHGRSKIRAADAVRTQIIGNFRFDYQSAPIQCERYPWWDRFLVKGHTEIECDPKVWNQIEALIRANLS